MESRYEARVIDGIGLKPAPGRLALVQGFVNTRNVMRGYDLLGGVGGASSWLREQGFLGEDVEVVELDRRLLVAFREGLRGLLLAHNGEPGGGASAAEALNELLTGSANLRARFDAEGEPVLEPTVGTGAVVEEVMGRIAAAVVVAAGEGTWRRLKACRNEGCLWAFYDRSKNRSGSWCTMDVCGARAKMSAYRRRKT